jgi:glucosamine kinase
MMATLAVIGIDGGGTYTRALVMDESERELGRSEGGPALTDRAMTPVDIDAVSAAAERAAAEAKVRLPVDALCAGFAGVGREVERKTVEEAFSARGLARSVSVITDGEAAFFDAFGDGPGLLLVSGTGSLAWGRSEDGRQARVGGWGTLLGDEGSGYDIGRSALRAAARAADGRGAETALLSRLMEQVGAEQPDRLIPWAIGATKSAIAALAPTVCEVAEEGDGPARDIVTAAIGALTVHAATLLEKLAPWSAAPGIALVGGMLAPAGPLRAGLVESLVGLECVVLEEPIEPVRGAARFALRGLN